MDVAAATLVDEPDTGEEDEVPASRDTRNRVRTYLVRAGSVRRDTGTVWAFGRRQLGDRYCLVEFGPETKAVVCFLPAEGVLLVDRGGPTPENEFVAALLGGYDEYHDGEFELRARPVTAPEASGACAALAAAGLTTDDGEGCGPFADALGRIAAGVAAAPTARS
jgi:hypothetical protein